MQPNADVSESAKVRWTLRPSAGQVGPAALPSWKGPQSLLKLLQQRGVNEEHLQSRLSPKLANLIDPFKMLGMDVAVARLVQAFQAKEAVCIYADFDLDGTSGLALFYEGLKQLGFENLHYYQPKRLSEGYGFHAHAVEALLEKNVKVIVTVDVGITALEATTYAKQKAVDVIITDHHQPGAILPEALTIVNPNQAGDTSGLGYLCGAGVAFYLLRAVKRGLSDAKIETAVDLRGLLDFLTIATLTDLVPLKGDNLALVKHGLLQLEKTERPGLRCLLESLGLQGRPLSAQDVAIRLAPKLNALSRLENGLLPVDLFLVADKASALAMMSTVLSNNEDRVQLQQSGEQEAEALLKGWSEPDFVFVSSPHFHRGVIGLIATRLAQNWNRPAFVGSETIEENEQERLIVGSARCPNGQQVSVLSALASAGSGLNRFGGHHAAAGFELHATKTKELIQNLRSHFQALQQNPQPVEVHFDVDLAVSDIQPQFLRWMDCLGPFGVGFDVPVFRLKNLRVLQVNVLKGLHWKLSLHGSDGAGKIEALCFSPPPGRTKPEVGQTLDVLGELQWNYFAGTQRIQVLIRDWKHEEGAP